MSFKYQMDNDFFVDLTSEQISDFSWRNFPDNVKIVFLTVNATLRIPLYPFISTFLPCKFVKINTFNP